MHWKLSFLIGAPATVLVVAVAAVVVVLAFKYGDETFEKVAPSIGAVLLGGTIAIPLFVMTSFPLSAEYLQWRPVEGVVESIDKRLIASDDGMSERYVVSIDGYGVPYSIDDTRAATLREGDDVSLICTREWQWAATDGYACRWNQ